MAKRKTAERARSAQRLLNPAASGAQVASKIGMGLGRNVTVAPETNKLLGALPDPLPPFHQVARALADGHRTLDEIVRATGLSPEEVSRELHGMHTTGSAVPENATGAWRLGETVQMPVRKDLAPKVQEWLDKQPAVSEGMVEIPRSVAGSATELVQNPNALNGIVRKLMEAAKGGVSKKTDKDFVDDCVQAFLACSASAISQARDGGVGFDGMRDEAATQNARRISAAFARARLFCVRPERFLAANLVADRFTTERLAGQKWEAYSGKPVSGEDSKRLIEAYMEHGTTWPFPDPLPFESMFICYGREFDIAKSGLVLEGRVTQEMLDFFGNPDVLLFGHLLWWEGDQAFCFTCIAPNPGPDSQVKVEPLTPGFIVAYDGEWAQPMSLDPWILNMLVREINDHKTVSEAWTQTLSQRMDRKKLGKKLKTILPLPEPFYLVELKDELIEPPEYRSNAVAPKLVEWSHRWDVRGHEVVRVIRGQLPLSPEDAAKYKKRGYRLYVEGRVTDPDDQARTLKRGIRGPGLNEWMGVMAYWREAFVKGPGHLPYVPAARV